MSDILNRMSITRFMEIQEEKALPIDGIEHCPKGLRITDGIAKESFNSSWTQKKKSAKPKKPLQRIKSYHDGKEVFEGTIRETEKYLQLPYNTIKTAMARKGKTRTGHSFKETTCSMK